MYFASFWSVQYPFCAQYKQSFSLLSHELGGVALGGITLGGKTLDGITLGGIMLGGLTPSPKMVIIYYEQKYYNT